MYYFRTFSRTILKILLFFLSLQDLLQRWCSTCLVYVHTLPPRENREGKSPEYFKIFEKTIFNEHPVPFLKLTILFLKKKYFFSYLDFITFLFFLLYLLKARIFYNIHMYLTYTLFVTFLAIKWFPDLILKFSCPLT